MKTVRARIASSRYLYLLLILPTLYFLLFRYLPMAGLVITFKDYNIFRGIWQSPWVGLDNFRKVFAAPEFWLVLRNTLVISSLKLLVGFPAPLILALLLNEMRSAPAKRVVQTVLYLPHFISWVILGGIVLAFLSPVTGIIGPLMDQLGLPRTNLLTNPGSFFAILVISDVWKEAGWGTIIYLAALSQVDPNLYEAATIDGATRFQQIFHVTIPAISSVIVILLILRLGQLMNAGFEQILVLQNPVVRSVSEIFDTFVYRVGLGRGEYSFTAALGFFKSLVAAILIVSADRISKRFGEEGLL